VIASILIVAILILGVCLLIYRKAVKIMSSVNDINAVLDATNRRMQRAALAQPQLSAPLQVTVS